MKTRSVQAAASQLAIFAAVIMEGRSPRTFSSWRDSSDTKSPKAQRFGANTRQNLRAKSRYPKTKIFSGMPRNPRVGLVRRCLARSGSKTACRRSRAAEENTTQGGLLIAIGCRGRATKPSGAHWLCDLPKFSSDREPSPKRREKKRLVKPAKQAVLDGRMGESELRGSSMCARE